MNNTKMDYEHVTIPKQVRNNLLGRAVDSAPQTAKVRLLCGGDAAATLPNSTAMQAAAPSGHRCEVGNGTARNRCRAGYRMTATAANGKKKRLHRTAEALS